MEPNKLQKLIWMLELALELAKQGLEAPEDSIEKHIRTREKEVFESFESGFKLKKSKKQKKERGIMHECCQSKATRHKAGCENATDPKNIVINSKKPSVKSLAATERWKARKANKENGVNGKEANNQPMSCSECEQEFVYNGLLIDATCPECRSSAVFKI